ncbi:MAG: cation transporter [Betaproteobacteria bacterium]|nr:cation transporter [Betaproteobacteria bacterium]
MPTARTRTHDPSPCPHDGGHAPMRADPGQGHDLQNQHAHHHDHAHEHDHALPHVHHDGAIHQHDYRAHDKSLLLVSFAITVSTMAVEIIGGLLTHSLALVSDGIHMFTHAFALGLSWGAIVLASRPANMEKTFGYYRVEVVAAFVNGITILLSAIWIVIEGVTRLIAPEPVAIGTTLIIAIGGLVINLITGAILMRGDQSNLNIRSAFLHMLTDTLSSVAIIAGLVAIHYTGWQFIDPLLALVVAVIILKWSWTLLRDSLHVLMEGSPIDVAALKAHVLHHFPEVLDIHDVHIWQISQRFNCLTAHVRVKPDAVTDYTALVARINQSLRDKFEIGHTNFQPEWGSPG